MSPEIFRLSILIGTVPGINFKILELDSEDNIGETILLNFKDDPNIYMVVSNTNGNGTFAIHRSFVLLGDKIFYIYGNLDDEDIIENEDSLDEKRLTKMLYNYLKKIKELCSEQKPSMDRPDSIYYQGKYDDEYTSIYKDDYNGHSKRRSDLIYRTLTQAFIDYLNEGVELL